MKQYIFSDTTNESIIDDYYDTHKFIKKKYEKKPKKKEKPDSQERNLNVLQEPKVNKSRWTKRKSNKWI